MLLSLHLTMEKIKSRWCKNYLEGDISNTDGPKDHNDISNTSGATNLHTNENTTNHHRHHHRSRHSLPTAYEPISENIYLDKRRNEHSRSRKDARSMVCDCVLTKEERSRGVMGCLDDCLNRMLMIECGPKCTLGDHCLNKRFQKCQSAKVEVFKTHKKGWGLRTTTDLPANSFIMEYVGEVVRSKEFKSRVKKYTKQKIKHHYFMALGSDEIIDATVKGNFTRFINHSCEPNCETQKWTVDGYLRIGFFTIRDLRPGEEITFDYQFQRYGRKAQKCYCGAPSCRGFIGGVERTFTLNGNSSPTVSENKAHKKSYKHSLLVDDTLEDKISPGFKIPRLNRLQRIEIEEKMVREALANDTASNEKSILEQRYPFLNRNYFKPSVPPVTTNGSVNSTTPKNVILPTKRKFDSLTTNNIDLTPAPKISKEEHRQQFEMYARLKDYYDTIEVPTKRKIDSLTTNNIDLTPAPKMSKEEHRLQFEIHARLKDFYDTIERYHGTAAVEQMKLSINCLPPMANYTIDDELAACLCDYEESYSRPMTVEDVTDKQYPYPGSYYTTPHGERWFATVTLDRKTQLPRTVILKLNSRKLGAQHHQPHQQQQLKVPWQGEMQRI